METGAGSSGIRLRSEACVCACNLIRPLCLGSFLARILTLDQGGGGSLPYRLPFSSPPL